MPRFASDCPPKRSSVLLQALFAVADKKHPNDLINSISFLRCRTMLLYAKLSFSHIIRSFNPHGKFRQNTSNYSHHQESQSSKKSGILLPQQIKAKCGKMQPCAPLDPGDYFHENNATARQINIYCQRCNLCYL